MTKNVFILIAAIIGCNCTVTNNRPSSYNVRQALKRKIEQRLTYTMRDEHPDRTIALEKSGQDIDVTRDTNVNSDNSDEIEIVYDAKRSTICNNAKRRRRRAIPTDEALNATSMGLASTFDAGINEDQCLDDNNSHSILFSTLLANKAASLIRCENSPRNNLSKDALYQAQQDCITNNNVARHLEIQDKHGTAYGYIQKTRSSMDEASSAIKGIDNGVYSNVAGNTRVDGYIFHKSDPIGTIAVILSFASLNIYKEIFKPIVHRNTISERDMPALPINNMNVDEANVFAWQQTRSDYRFYFMIKFIDKKFLLPDFERKDLYLTIDNTCYWFLPQIDKALQFQESIERFIGSYEDDKNITYQQIQELYLSFIAYTCFEYHKKLRCRVLKEELWGMHCYMSEFYFYIMWKLEDIYYAYKFVIGQEKEFKLHLINEMEYILMMMKIYRDINEAEESVRDVLVGKLFFVICKYRKEIRRYLKVFNKPNSLQVFYFLMDVYVNDSAIEAELPKIAEVTNLPGHVQPNFKTERLKSRDLMLLLEDERYLQFFGSYQTAYNKKDGKIAVALLAFIISPKEYVVNSLTVDEIPKLIEEKKASNSNLLYRRTIESSTNNQKFTDSIRYLFRFLYFIRINKCSTSKSVDFESERDIRLTQRTLVAWIYDNKFEVNLDTIVRIHECMLTAMGFALTIKKHID